MCQWPPGAETCRAGIAKAARKESGERGAWGKGNEGDQGKNPARKTLVPLTSLHDYVARILVEHAKFPFPDPLPDPVKNRYVGTDISSKDVGDVAPNWRAKYAVPDRTLVQKLCQTLDSILGDTVLPDDCQNDLLLHFGHHLQFRTIGTTEIEISEWSENGSGARSRRLLEDGCFKAANTFFALFAKYSGGRRFNTTEKHIERGLSKVDYLVVVNDKRVVLVEAKSPSVMKAVGSSLSDRSVELDWTPGGDLVSKVLPNAALYLGVRKTEWLFLTCHNYWIVCRLVNDDDKPFLAFSPMFSIEDSSEPFRAFLGVILSVLTGAPVQASEFNPTMVLDIIPKEGDGGPLPDDDINEGLVEYQGRSTTDTSSTLPMTRSRATTSDAEESQSMFTLSSQHYPESFQVWVHLHSLPNNTFILPHCAENGHGKRRLWLTRHIGFGWTGNVVELLRTSDAERRQRFYNEVGVYLSLETAYQSGQLHNRITPHCYGAFEGDGINALILGLCGDTLNSWDELDFSEQTQVYELVRDLHRVGIVHGDLRPRNVARVPGGGFRLINFSGSRRHTCVEISVRYGCSFQLNT
ncbi:hypothetical protein EDB89DRAFT_2112700 [Lactarius sanguifluus]|nr:hypothetical protein EDB89DRAFT_2112700 [Lactarius sanguifluus]